MTNPANDPAPALAPRFDRDGLVTAIAQHADTGEILMVAHMNAEALAATLRTREAFYWSRSRNALWHKGASSGQIQKVVEIRVDCDQDAVLLQVHPQGDGGACHEGYRACFFRRVEHLADGTARLVTVGAKLSPPV